MHNISAVFFDLDGTLIDPATHTVPQSNIEAVYELIEESIPVYVATGRDYGMVKSIPIIKDIPFSGYVCSNGQQVFDHDGSVISSHFFSSTQVDQLVALCAKENMAINLVSPTCTLAPLGITHYMIQAHSFFNEPLPEVIKKYNNEDVYMALIYNDMSYDFTIVESIEGLRTLTNHSTYADVVLASVAKSTGIDAICQRHQIAKENTMAFGDGGNDIDMLKFVGIGIAMGNASDDVKASSDFVTKSVADKGITHALRHFQLIGE